MNSPCDTCESREDLHTEGGEWKCYNSMTLIGRLWTWLFGCGRYRKHVIMGCEKQ